MGRVLTSEILDVLSPDDPRALRSRRDLMLINAVMCQSLIMAEAQYVYNSPVKYVLPNAMTYTEKSYLRPRLVDPIPDPGAPCT